ncbi:hypothetical protein HY522_02725 [bacterium]|nr:hypothetical protein [bacterium]
MRRILFAGLSALCLLAGPAAADTAPAPRPEYYVRFDTAVYPPPGKKPYKKGQRLVYTIWIDNDDPGNGMQDIVLHLPPLPAGQRLDLSDNQPPYGNIFIDSRFVQRSDTPINCHVFYISNPEGDRRRLTYNTPSSAIGRVLWVCTRGNSEEVVAPHNGNDDINAKSEADVRYGAPVDADEIYFRYAVIVDPLPKFRKR